MTALPLFRDTYMAAVTSSEIKTLYIILYNKLSYARILIGSHL